MAAAAVSASARTVIKFHFDIVSPYSYLAFVVLMRYRKRWDYDLILKPMYLGSIMMASGNKPPMTVPNKGVHSTTELAMLKALWNVKLQVPDNFPPQTLYAMRLLRAIQDQEPAKLESATAAFFTAMFVESVATWTDPETLTDLVIRNKIASEARAAELLKASQQAKYKDACKDEAGELVKAGAFGFPWMHVTNGSTGESANFFGSDRFELLAYFIGKRWEGPNPDGGASKL